MQCCTLTVTSSDIIIDLARGTCVFVWECAYGSDVDGL